jgi:hypothetical protein
MNPRTSAKRISSLGAMATLLWKFENGNRKIGKAKTKSFQVVRVLEL